MFRHTHTLVFPNHGPRYVQEVPVAKGVINLRTYEEQTMGLPSTGYVLREGELFFYGKKLSTPYKLFAVEKKRRPFKKLVERGLALLGLGTMCYLVPVVLVAALFALSLASDLLSSKFGSPT